MYTVDDATPITGGELRSNCPSVPDYLIHEKSIALFNIYLKELVRWNRYLNLVSTATTPNGDATTLSIKAHIYEALNGYPYLQDRELSTQVVRVCDVGSGNGIPGVPLAILDPSIEIILIERSLKRCAFLASVRAALARPIEIEAKDYRKVATQCDWVVFRALAPLNSRIVRGILPLVCAGGGLLAYKGRLGRALDESAHVRPYFERVDVHRMQPSPYERTVIVAHNRVMNP